MKFDNEANRRRIAELKAKDIPKCPECGLRLCVCQMRIDEFKAPDKGSTQKRK